MTNEQLNYFHRNLRYMWDKLGTTYYQVKRGKPGKENGVIGAELLPAYSTLSKCMNDDTYEPPRSAVYGIVQFYNKNIFPEIDPIRFVSVDLSLTNESNYRVSDKVDERFVGKYCCYYLPESEGPDDGVIGGYLQIAKEGTLLRAALVTGIRNDTEFRSPELLRIFDSENKLKAFEDYYNSRRTEDQRCTYYEGSVEITHNSVLIVARSVKKKKLILALNVESFPADESRDYLGGMAFVLATADSMDTRLYKMGIINMQPRNKGDKKEGGRHCSAKFEQDLFASLENEEVAKQLAFTDKGSNRVKLTTVVDAMWYGLIMKLHKERDGKNFTSLMKCPDAHAVYEIGK